MATATGATLGAIAQTSIPADKDAYDALTFVEVGEISTIGPLGETNERVTFNRLKTVALKVCPELRMPENLQSQL